MSRLRTCAREPEIAQILLDSDVPTIVLHAAVIIGSSRAADDRLP
jgi:hypothetical protein